MQASTPAPDKSPLARLELLNRVAAAEAEGVPFAAACRAAGALPGRVRGWRAAWRADGLAGLAADKPTGRPDYAALLSDAAIRRVRELALVHGSAAMAWDFFKDDPLCPAEIAGLLAGRTNGDTLPLSLRRAAAVTPEVAALHRGERAYQLGGWTQLRDWTEVLPDGTRREIQPGDWWEMDDMSVNHPFWYETDCPVCGANPKRDGEYRAPGPGCSKIAHRWGCEVGRQSLWALDMRSCKWLGFEMIGRPRDAYRAEDILRFLRKLFQTYGLPRRGLRLEKGCWASKRIKGCALNVELRADEDYAEALADYDQAGMADTDKEIILGGLAALGLETHYVSSPHGKGMIEGAFDHLQGIVAGIGDR